MTRSEQAALAASFEGQATLANIGSLGTLNERLTPLAFRAGWNKAEPSLWPQPRTAFRPAYWAWREARAGLESAGHLISTEQADRRNLFMVNPVEGNTYATLRTIVSAHQMILPGERARSHRHTPNALRLVMEAGPATYTVVDGVRIDMKPNDVVLTPGWSWHGHGNDGDRPGHWIDFLDVPLVHLLEPMFLEHWPAGFQEPERTTRDSPFVFAWDEVEPRLAAAGPDESGRVRVELGSPALPTLSLAMEKLVAGRQGATLRSTESQVFAVVSGRGRTEVGDRRFEWSRGDVLAVPSWHAFRHAASEDAVLFSVSDRPVLEKLGFLKVDVSEREMAP